MGLSKRKAISLPFPQALPQLWTIDADHCFYFQRNQACRICAKVCPANAIDYAMKPEEVKVEVGAVIVATGYAPFDAARVAEYGFGKFPEVYHGLQFERLGAPPGATPRASVQADGPAPPPGGGGRVAYARGCAPRRRSTSR